MTMEGWNQSSDFDFYGTSVFMALSMIYVKIRIKVNAKNNRRRRRRRRHDSVDVNNKSHHQNDNEHSIDYIKRWEPKRFHHHFDIERNNAPHDHYHDIMHKNGGKQCISPTRANSEPIDVLSSDTSKSFRSNMSYLGNLLFRQPLHNSSVEDSDEDSLCKQVQQHQHQQQPLPNRLIMIRHGQSEGNIDESIYAKSPDNDICLTKLGWEQAQEAGKILRNQILNKSNGRKSTKVHFIVSPYVRTMETFHGLVSAWCDPKDFYDEPDEDKRLLNWYNQLATMGVTFNEDPRIREQDFGNYQDKEEMKNLKKERFKFGIFYYRFPNGESGCDVFDRMSTFLDSLWRSFSLNESQNYVLVTHGISIRVLLARYFRYSVDQFNLMGNPGNCEMIILGHDQGRLELEGRCELQIEKNEKGEETKVIGHKFYKQLNVVSKHHIRNRSIKMSYI